MRAAAGEALHVSGFAAEGDFALGIVPQQFAPEQGVIRCRSAGEQIDPAADEVRVFAEHHAQQPDGRRLRHGIVACISRPDRLRSARDEIDTQLCRRSGEFDRLSEVEQCVGAHQRGSPSAGSSRVHR